MTMKTTYLCLIALSITSPILAQTVPGAAAFQRLDRNRDGKLTPDEAPRAASFAAADADKDGAVTQDLVVLDRSEIPGLGARAMLWMNKGGGMFEPKPTTFSGLDGSGISGEAADLNNDGLLDLVFAADPDNSGVVLSMLPGSPPIEPTCSS